MTERIKTDIERLKKDFPGLIVTELTDGTVYVKIPEFHLTDWWTPPISRLLLVIKPDFPQTCPQFYVREDIQRPDKQPPAGASGPQKIDGEQWKSLCWQWNWNPTKETLWRLVKAIKQRFYEQA